jgi:competence protein ComGC
MSFTGELMMIIIIIIKILLLVFAENEGVN